MNNQLRRTIILSILLASMVGFQAHAATITHSWTGSIIGVMFDDGGSIYSGTQTGDTFSGEFTFDPDVNNITGLDTFDGDSIIEASDTWVEYFAGSSSGSVTNGTTQLNGSGVTVSITNDHPADEPGEPDVIAALLGSPAPLGTLTDNWGLDFGNGLTEVGIVYESLDINRLNDLSFRSLAPWSPPDSPPNPFNQVAYFQITTFNFEFDD